MCCWNIAFTMTCQIEKLQVVTSKELRPGDASLLPTVCFSNNTCLLMLWIIAIDRWFRKLRFSAPQKKRRTQSSLSLTSFTVTVLCHFIEFLPEEERLTVPKLRMTLTTGAAVIIIDFSSCHKRKKKIKEKKNKNLLSSLYFHWKVNWAAWGQFALISRWELLIVWFTTCGLKLGEDCQPPAEKHCWVSDGCVCVCECVWVCVSENIHVCVCEEHAVWRKEVFCMYVCNCVFPA